MSDENSKAYSAWPQPPAPQGKCHVRILVQDSRCLTSEVVIPCVNWTYATGLQAALRAVFEAPSASAGQEGPSSARGGKEPKSDV